MLTLSCFWATYLDTGVQSDVLVISEWNSCQDPMLECASNIVNTDVLDRFHFFHFFINFESSRLDFSDFWKLFGALG